MNLEAKRLKLVLMASVFAVLVFVAVLYLLVGCEQDWVVIGGLCLDIIGAFLFAAPDLEKYRKNSRVGRLHTLHRRVVSDPKERYISKMTTTDETFLDVMDDTFGGEQVSESSIFQIRKLGGRGLPVNYLLSHKKEENADDKKVSLANVDRNFRENIRKEESAVRRLGAMSLLTGFSLQILGLTINQIPLIIPIC